MLASEGWSVEVDTETLAMQTGQTAEGLADMHLALAEVAMLANHDLTREDREAIRGNLRDGFGRLDGSDNVNVPAEVHFFTATVTG